MPDRIDPKIYAQALENFRRVLAATEIKTIKPEAALEVSSDSRANKEAVAFANDNLEIQAQKSKHRRHEQTMDMFAKGFKCIFWAAIVCILAVAFVWVWHLIAPDNWHFVSPERLEKINQTLFGGVISSLVTGYAKNHLK
ncbi:MAG: hypothetical protein COB93_00210 [Sneathiella sp.]|nr:MAG: hypothetical protein COB93_00210 [Sneathiella sp.]